MNIRHYIAALCSAVLLVGCSDDPVSSSEPGGGKPTPGPSVESDDPQLISLSVGNQGLANTIHTRGYGVVGGLKGSTENVWQGEDLFIYVVNRFAEDLSQEYVDEEKEIPTFLKMGEKVSAPGADEITDSGFIEFAKDAKYKYYPLNGAYNFMGYHLDDAEVVSAPALTDDNSAYEMKIKIDGTQDVMIANATLSKKDTLTFIQWLINSEKLDKGTSSEDYYQDFVAFNLEEDVWNVINKELTERHYSSYSNRRDIRPNLNFEHQLTRLTFQVVGGNKDALVSWSERPKIRFAEWEHRKYNEGDFFIYQGDVYYVKADTKDALYEDELFGNAKNKAKFLVCLNFRFSDVKSAGERIVYKNELYEFYKDYDGKATKWETIELNYVSNITKSQVQFTEGRTYQAGDCVISPEDDKCWIAVATVPKAGSWDKVKGSSIPFCQGVFISKVELLNVPNQATLRLTSKSLSFIPTTNPAETDDIVLKQYEVKEADKEEAGEEEADEEEPAQRKELVDLQPVGPEHTLEEYGTDDKQATRVGESVMVMPGATEFFANIYVTEYVDKNGNLVDSDLLGGLDGGHIKNTKVYKNTRIRIDKEGKTSFEAGGSYMVTITAYALEGIDVNTNLIAWNPGGNLDIDPEDQLFNGVNAISKPVAYYGVSEELPGEHFSVMKESTEWESKEVLESSIEFSTPGVHWFAIRDDYELVSFINEDNDRDYLNPRYDQLKRSDYTYKITINITATETKEFVYHLYYTVDSEGNPFIDLDEAEVRKYTVTIKDKKEPQP